MPIKKNGTVGLPILAALDCQQNVEEDTVVFEQLKEELFSFGTRNQEEQADQTRICKELFFCSGKLLECFYHFHPAAVTVP